MSLLNHSVDKAVMKEIFGDNQWKPIGAGHAYLVSESRGIVVTKHVGDKMPVLPVAVQEITELQLLQYYKQTGCVLVLDEPHEVYELSFNIDYTVYRSVCQWLGIEPKNHLAPTVVMTKLTLGNSNHPVAKYGLKAKRVPGTDAENYPNTFYLEVDNDVVVISDTHAVLIEGGLDVLKRLIANREPLLGESEMILDTDKYPGNAVMRLLKKN